MSQLRASREGMFFLQSIDAELFKRKLLDPGKEAVEAVDDHPAEPAEPANWNLLKLEHTLLKLAASEACQGVFYFLCMKTKEREEAVVR